MLTLHALTIASLYVALLFGGVHTLRLALRAANEDGIGNDANADEVSSDSHSPKVATRNRIASGSESQ